MKPAATKKHAKMIPGTSIDHSFLNTLCVTVQLGARIIINHGMQTVLFAIAKGGEMTSGDTRPCTWALLEPCEAAPSWRGGTFNLELPVRSARRDS